MYKKNIQLQTEQRISGGKFVRMPAHLKEQWRREFDQVRDQFESQNEGQYERLYPCHDKPAKMEEYAMLIKSAKDAFIKAESTKFNKLNKRANNLSLVQQPKPISPQKKERRKIVAHNIQSAQQVHLSINPITDETISGPISSSADPVYLS